MKTSHLFTFILLLLFLPLSLVHAAIDVKNMDRVLLYNAPKNQDNFSKVIGRNSSLVYLWINML